MSAGCELASTAWQAQRSAATLDTSQECIPPADSSQPSGQDRSHSTPGEQLSGYWACCVQAEQAAQADGEQLAEEPFDSNCITPGTPFMQRLGAHLRFFIRRKLATDAVWQQPEVVFSGTSLSCLGLAR